MKSALKKLDQFLDHHAAILIIVALVLIARLPNLSEPYWYGDEAIYLTIGQALNKGYTLYSEIIDHKTPIIYYLARVGTQFNFRVLTMVWTAAATALFYIVSFQLFGRRKQATLAAGVFALLTTMPWLEGNIPNGELFVLGFVLAGAALLTTTKYWKSFFDAKATASALSSKRQPLLLLLSGMFLSLGILTKVPAVFDLAAFLSIGFLSGLLTLTSSQSLVQKRTALVELIGQWILLFVGVAVPIVVSILYFVSKGAGNDYLQFGLLYNFRYAGTWQLDIQNPVLAFLFTFPGKLTALAAVVALVSIFHRRLRPQLSFSVLWFYLALVATLLSNRPYPHYLVQLIPPFALMVALLVHEVQVLGKRLFSKSSSVPVSVGILSVSALSIFLVVAPLLFLQVRPYPALSYYQRWWLLVSGRLPSDVYRNSFNAYMNDNYIAAKIIKANLTDRMFIWGTNPMLYALSGASPAGRFTVAFHIETFDAYDETLQDIMRVKPEFIVVMNDHAESFPELQQYLRTNYKPHAQTFEHFVLWRRNIGS